MMDYFINNLNEDVKKKIQKYFTENQDISKNNQLKLNLKFV